LRAPRALTRVAARPQNIDGYLQRIYTGLGGLEELVRKINDVVDNRIESNLRAVSATRLVDLPRDKSFTFEDFVSHQSAYIKARTGELVVRNQEVQRAVHDLHELIRAFPRENTADVSLGEAEITAFTRHYSRLMYIAIRASTRASLAGMKGRLARRPGSSLMHERPLFDVEVELAVPSVSLKPSLEDIQNAVNATAKRVLRASMELPLWAADAGGAGPAGAEHIEAERAKTARANTARTGGVRSLLGGNSSGPRSPRWKVIRAHFGASGGTFFELIARDNEIVKAILLLTGSVEGTNKAVLDFVGTFSKYDFLWKLDLAAEYAAFVRTSPSVEGFEGELRKYMALEGEVAAITPAHTIGALRLHTGPLRASLKAEAAAWKTAFAKNLHSQALEDLRAMHDYMRDTTLKLSRPIEDLEDVRNVMDLQRELRDREAEIDTLMTPIEEIYALLTRYEVRVPREETDLLADLRPNWRKVHKISCDTSDTLAGLQEGFKRDLIKEVKAFVADAAAFRSDWETNGPMVNGLEPTDAADRLKKFQQLFELRKRKWNNFASGEELFGMAVTLYPELEKTEREIALLDRLYALYLAVLAAFDGYAEVHWSDLGVSLDNMSDQVNAFSAQAKKLPKSLREWPAYLDCKKRIEDFLTLVPMIQSLLSKAMRPRHWEALQTITGKQLDLREDVFLLGHMFAANLQEHIDDVRALLPLLRARCLLCARVRVCGTHF
jgi:dynein heavy chain